MLAKRFRSLFLGQACDLDLTGKDLALLKAVADSSFAVGGFCNKDPRQLLAKEPRHVGKTEKQRSGMTIHAMRLLRDHGVIRRACLIGPPWRSLEPSSSEITCCGIQLGGGVIHGAGVPILMGSGDQMASSTP